MFFLSRNDCTGLPAIWRQAHAQVGFDRCVSLEAGDWTLHLWAKLDGSGPHYVRKGEDFAACTGIFFYRGQRLELGLELLLGNFDGKSFPWLDCHGHYAVIVFKAGRLWLSSDELGAYKIYRNLDATQFSSSFSAMRATLRTALPETQGIYEYVFNGATFGEKTLLRDVKQQREGTLYSFRESGPPKTTTASVRQPQADYSSVEEAADDYAERLRALFRIYSAGNKDFRAALSGGYDSRLILALLLDAGVEPTLYVYGNDQEADVVIAREIARGEGLHLERIDKDLLQQDQKASPELAWTRFDSWNNAGLFDNGVDDDDRRKRAKFGVDILNGSGGECFRNFFYLRSGCYRPEEIVWSFYSRYDPLQVTRRFRQAAYRDELAEDMRLALPGNPRQTKLERAQVEALYPRFRVRYWTGRDVGLNQRFGPLLFPFLEPSVFSGTERIPIRFKDNGRLEALILKKISPKLASYQTAYGFALSGDPPLRYRMKMALTLYRPTYVRQFTYRVRRRLSRRQAIPSWFSEALEAAHLDPRLPAMREFFQIDQITDIDVLNRAATAELVLRGGPWRAESTE